MTCYATYRLNILERSSDSVKTCALKLITYSTFTGTLENLTTLEILDISGNGLVDKVLDDVRVFGTQVNLTHLSMHSNRFTRLPVADLTKHKRLVTLDIRNNRIQGYDPEFTDMVKNQGLQIRYFGRQTNL